MESEPTQEQLLKRNIYLNKWKIITNWILIILILAIGIYVIKEVELFKQLGGDVCKLCSYKTGANCFLPIDIN